MRAAASALGWIAKNSRSVGLRAASNPARESCSGIRLDGTLSFDWLATVKSVAMARGVRKPTPRFYLPAAAPCDAACAPQSCKTRASRPQAKR